MKKATKMENIMLQKIREQLGKKWIDAVGIFVSIVIFIAVGYGFLMSYGFLQGMTPMYSISIFNITKYVFLNDYFAPIILICGIVWILILLSEVARLFLGIRTKWRKVSMIFVFAVIVIWIIFVTIIVSKIIYCGTIPGNSDVEHCGLVLLPHF